MSKRKRRQTRAGCEPQKQNPVALWLSDADLCVSGYTRLSDNPEIQTACLRIAELIGSMTIYLMSNTEQGDVRIVNELSRMIDITPNGNMTRAQWMTAIVMNLLLYGKGNSIVIPHTYEGILRSLEPIAASRVQLMPVANSYRDYRVLIDGVARDPANVMHIAYNPDPTYLWRGQGVTVTLRDIANNLKQAQRTENAYMSTEWKPSIIIKAATNDEFLSTPEGRSKFLEMYVKTAKEGEPWLLPLDQMDVQQVKPLTLADLAIKDTVELDKKTVAAVVGVPAFLLGVGSYNREEWNTFIQTKVRVISQNIAQEMTRALITSHKWYLQFNYWSLIDYDMKAISDVLLAGSDRGFVNGDEWRDRMHMAPAGLTEFRVLENYIPGDMAGQQSKLVGNA